MDTRFVSLVVLIAMGFIPHLAQAAVTLGSQTRSVRYGHYKQATPYGQSIGATDLDSTTTITATDFSPFLEDFGSTFSAGTSGISQHSSLSTTSITASGFTQTGSGYSAGNIYVDYIIAGQSFSATFILSSPTDYQMVVNQPATTPPNTIVAPETINLTGPSNLNFYSYYPAPPGPATYTGKLAPGTWMLSVPTRLASSFPGSTPNYSYYYDFNLALTPVPEPATTTVLLAAPLLLRRRRVRFSGPVISSSWKQ